MFVFIVIGIIALVLIASEIEQSRYILMGRNGGIK